MRRRAARPASRASIACPDESIVADSARTRSQSPPASLQRPEAIQARPISMRAHSVWAVSARRIAIASARRTQRSARAVRPVMR
ncbi:MAG: hypothetical protein E6K81_16205 [Candidatus Eisenbacteria bacterium]|uniref:Uncharacterized protein n=1 Tax=Eiseniibacteriota bacterium TaxID=2212470 RepID=A0A538TYW3_UNCEI|nr:MAG: hypothetical protein E6K81_16205 [Candidatus Eisenbacteria bacterium]